MNGIQECLKLEFVPSVNLPTGIENGKVREISLTQGKVALVDEKDYDRLSKHKWYAAKSTYTFYAQREVRINGTRLTISMHREILGLIHGDGRIPDHRNRDGLDNRKENLRIVTYSVSVYNRNMLRSNTSGFRGVNWCWYHQINKWRARIQVGRKMIHGGYYLDPIDAALAYDNMAIKYFGNDAILNFPER